jgi:ribonuclease E
MADLDAGSPAQDPDRPTGAAAPGPDPQEGPAADPAGSGPRPGPSAPTDTAEPGAAPSALDPSDADTSGSDGPAGGGAEPDTARTGDDAPGDDSGEDRAHGTPARRRRRRGSRGGRNRSRPRTDATDGDTADGDGGGETDGTPAPYEQDHGSRGRASRTDERIHSEPYEQDLGSGEVGDDDRGAGGVGDRAEGDDSSDRGRDRDPELPDRSIEGRPKSVEAAEQALVRRPSAKPRIGDTRPAPSARPGGSGEQTDGEPGEPGSGTGSRRRRRRGGRGRGSGGGQGGGGGGDQQVDERRPGAGEAPDGRDRSEGRGGRGRGRGKGRGGDGGGGRDGGGNGRGGRGGSVPTPIQAVLPSAPADLDDDELEARRGKERNGKPVGRYLMAVHVSDKATQIAVLEGRALLEHYVSRPADDISQIHGNIYLGKVQNVLPGMEAAFVDIATPKNAVLYRGDVQYDAEDVDAPKKGGKPPRIEDVLKAKQSILCQVTKNPIGAKGARLTQEISLPGRFVVLIPNSTTYGISKRLSDDERKRLRAILDRVKPKQHGVIVRTAAEGVTTAEIENDVLRLVSQWEQIEALAKRSKAPALLYREPDMAVRVIREEFNSNYRGVVIDDRELYEEVRAYVGSISPELADRVELYDPEAEKLPLYERFHVHEQVHKALDRKVWLPSGGSLIIERTEALTVIDVNTGKNVGTSSLEETVTRNNVEAAVEIAHQLRLRDIGGIIVIDFIDMEVKANRDEVITVFREALARDKTRTQVFEISELGLCEMTRKRIGEGLLESFADRCPDCDGRGLVVDPDLLPPG